MLQINLDDLDNTTQEEYEKFQAKVNNLLNKYKSEYPEKFQIIEDRIKNAHEWDGNIELISGNSRQIVNTSQLLAFEYCLGIERITNGEVKFENIATRLFSEVQKFKIGNPEKGKDDECLYGSSFYDKTAIPVTAKEYRLVMNAGAQHLGYVKGGKLTGAVFIYEKGEIKEIASDEKGKNPEDKKTDGINFKNLREGQPLLDNLRQTIFHEWTHTMEKVIVKPSEQLEYEYIGKDGKTYRNYQKVKKYVTAEHIGDFNEPDYHYEDYIDKDGNNKRRYYYEENGQKKYIEETPFDFKLQEGEFDEEICISTGLETREANGDKKIHNIVTEGFVEKTARAIVMAIDEEAKIDEKKYPEYVGIASQVISSRDEQMGKEGQTYADFLMQSSELKRDLESRTVQREDRTEVDGLHYISDYADKVQDKETDKAKFLTEKNMIKICTDLQLSPIQVGAIKDSELFEKMTLTDEDKKQLISLFLVGQNPDKEYVVSKVEEYVEIINREKEFFDTIPEKLGYRERTVEEKNNSDKKSEDLSKEIKTMAREGEVVEENEYAQEELGQLENDKEVKKENYQSID